MAGQEDSNIKITKVDLPFAMGDELTRLICGACGEAMHDNLTGTVQEDGTYLIQFDDGSHCGCHK